MKKYIITYYIIHNGLIASVNTEILNFHGHVNTIQLQEDLNARCLVGQKIAIIAVIPEIVGLEHIVKNISKDKVVKKKQETVKIVEPTIKERSSNKTSKNIDFQIIGTLEKDLDFLVGKKCTMLEKTGSNAVVFTDAGIFTIPLTNLTVFKES